MGFKWEALATSELLFMYSDGRLRENDQILFINNQPLNETAALRQAVQLLQAAQGKVKLVVAHGALKDYRGSVTENSPLSFQQSPNSGSGGFSVSIGCLYCVVFELT